MDSQHDSNNHSISLFSDPFPAPFTLPSTSAQLNITPISSNPLPLSSSAIAHHNFFSLASPSPSTPARHFNPDDFLVSPPQESGNADRPETQRATPELSRRLFVQSDTPGDDPVVGLSTTPREPSPKTSVFLTGLEDDHIPSPMAPLSFASPRHFLPAAIPPAANLPASDLSRVLASGGALDGSIITENPINHNNPRLLHPVLLDLGDEMLTPDSNIIIQKPLVLPAEICTGNEKQPEQIRKNFKPAPLRERQHPETVQRALVVPTSQPSGAQLPTTPFTPSVPAANKCSCKASRCLKLYCLCFANSGFCTPECSCKNCENKPSTESTVKEARDAVLLRDPRAFDPKLKQPSPASNGPKRVDIRVKGCNCRKGCLKKYCVCRELKVECGPRCTCSGPNGCLNRTFSSTKSALKRSFLLKRNAPNIKALPLDKASSGMVKKSTRSREAMEVSSSERTGRSKLEDVEGSSSSGASAGATLNTPDENEQTGASSGSDLMNCDSDVKDSLALEKEGEPGESNKSLEGGILNPNVENEAVQTRNQNFAHSHSNSPLQNHNEKIANNDDVKEKLRADMKDTSSDGKDGNLSGFDSRPRASEGSNSVFGQESDGAEACRLPRIFRVKMGSGRRLNKFSA